MKRATLLRATVFVGLAIFAAGATMAQQPAAPKAAAPRAAAPKAASSAPTRAVPAAASHILMGVNCDAPPAYHCPDEMCDGSIVTQEGNTVEMKTRRTFFLDCPTGYKPGDKVNVMLLLHGFGSHANWTRMYFPAVDVKDKYRLVIITPGSITRSWSEADDGYLQNTVDAVIGAVGKQNVSHFILAGHSQGGATSARLVCTPYFRDKVDVRISLSGGRVGPVSPGRNGGFSAGSAGTPVYRQDPKGAPAPARAASAGPGGAAPGRSPAPKGAAAAPPGGDCDYSFIFSNGENESIPGDTSPLADKFGCGKRVREADVIDPKKGYVWDSSQQDPGSDGWGHYPRSGRAQVFNFPNCKGGRIVADVVKLGKGHTEGYEPNITEKIVAMAVSAKGGKIMSGAWTPLSPEPQVTLGLPPAAPAARGPAQARAGTANR